MPTHDLQVNDVVQIDPEHHPSFGGLFMIVTEPKPWGAQGIIPTWNSADGRPMYAPYRCAHEHLEYIGRAAWSQPEEEEATSGEQQIVWDHAILCACEFIRRLDNYDETRSVEILKLLSTELPKEGALTGQSHRGTK